MTGASPFSLPAARRLFFPPLRGQFPGRVSRRARAQRPGYAGSGAGNESFRDHLRPAPRCRHRAGTGRRVRIFTVQEELPFAGHPTLGTAFALRGTTGAAEVVLDLNVGRVPVRFEDSPGQPVFGEMTQVDPKFGPFTIATPLYAPPGCATATSTLPCPSRRFPPACPSPSFRCADWM